MFVLCSHCQFLVATDPVSGQPPSLCPRCAEPMQAGHASAALPPVDVADTATEVAMDADGAEPTERLVERLHEPATKPVIAPSADPLAGPLLHDDTHTQAAIASEHAEGDDTTAPRGHASDASASEERVLREQAVDAPARNSPAIESNDTLIEAMRDPASMDIEVSMDDPSAMSDDPDTVVNDLLADVPTKETPQAASAEKTEASALPASQAMDPAPEAAPQDLEPADTSPAPVKTPPASRPAKPAPSFVRRPAAASGVSSRRRRLRAAAIGGLTLALALQLALADRARLATDARWRPAMATLCNVLHCALPPWREPAAFTLLQRDVRPHPRIDGALQVTATFRNDARWAQPLPGLLLTLSDIDGRVVAARTFMPKDYLGGAGRKTPTQTQTTLASGHSTAIEMDVVEPTPRIVAFTFDFK